MLTCVGVWVCRPYCDHMKRCPECRRDYYDETLLYCLEDGVALLQGPVSPDGPATAILHSTVAPGEAATRAQIQMKEAEPPDGWGTSPERQSLSAHKAAEPHPERQSLSAHRAAKPLVGAGV